MHSVSSGMCVKCTQSINQHFSVVCARYLICSMQKPESEKEEKTILTNTIKTKTKLKTKMSTQSAELFYNSI